MISFEPVFVIAIIIIVFILIYSNFLRPSVSFMLAIVVFMISGILTPEEVLDGFSNDKIASIILLILIAAALQKSFRLELLFEQIFGGTKNYKSFLFRMMGQVAILSSIINNTPVVALMTPYVVNWGKKYKISPSKLLIPLSFATIMGGMLTVIGTSTNLLLNGFLENYQQAPLESMDLLIIGGSVVVTGVLFLITIGYKLLPDHKDLLEQYAENKREFIAETFLSPKSPLVGKNIIEAGLRNLKGLYIVEIIRRNEIIFPVPPEEVLKAEDLILFAGNTEDIVNLVNSEMGLSLPPKIETVTGFPFQVDLVEGVINSSSSQIGKTVKETDFRNRYDAAVVAIHRAGEKLSGKIGSMKLKAGDMLLMFAGPGFTERIDLYRDIYVVSSQNQIRPSGKKNLIAIALIAVCIVALISYGQISLFSSLLIIFSIMVGFKMISMREIKRELDLDLVGILVFSLGLGTAIIKTDAGNLIGGILIELLTDYGNIAILIGLMMVTNLLTSLIGNIGAISISFPLAYSMSQSLPFDPAPLYLGIAFAASATFLTPISYQTNLIIFGPGGYNFKDFFKIGLPVTTIYLTVAVLVIIALYPAII